MARELNLSTNAYDLEGHIAEVNGQLFRITIERDDDADAPWDREDGHGPVTDWTTRDKRPGERLLNEDGRSRRYYDFAEACRIARADGWDAPPYNTGTRAQTAARAAEADFARLRAWCNDDWHYVGVIVTPIDDEDDDRATDYLHALWGIEDDSGEYLAEVAEELMEEATVSTTEARDAFHDTAARLHSGEGV